MTDKTKKTNKKNKVEDQIQESLQEIENLKNRLQELEEKEKRALADYKNLQRRTSEDRIKAIKFANKDLILSLLEPINHLSMAAKQLDDQGLNMVISQLWSKLNEFGLQEIDCLGEKFDINTMEVVDKKDKAEKVKEVVSRGYTLNGEVIKHAQVILD